MLQKSPLVLLIIGIVSLSIRGDEEVYENVNCSKCDCQNTTDTITLNCDGHGLEHILSNWPLENKTIIATFANNNITNLGMLPGTDAVLEVVFSNCGIRKLNPNAFESVKNIRFLDLSYNYLTNEELTAERFSGPTNSDKAIEPLALEYLNLAYNEIHSLDKSTFEHLPKLRRLNLEGNNLNVIDLHTQLAITSIKTLDGLNLANNKLTELVNDAVIKLKLVEIDLSKNELDFVPGGLIEIADTLEKLNLDDNPILEISDKSFLGMHKLIELSINNLTNVTYYGANSFSSLLKLKKLSASRNPQLTAIERQAFSPNQTLEEIYLNDNMLRDLDSELFSDWSKLRVFEIKNNQLECDCDLYNITTKLSPDITRREDGPYCLHPITGKSQPIYYLKDDICGVNARAIHIITNRFNMLRTVLVGLSVMLISTFIVAMLLGFIRWRKNRNYAFASEVLYNPLATNRF